MPLTRTTRSHSHDAERENAGRRQRCGARARSCRRSRGRTHGLMQRFGERRGRSPHIPPRCGSSRPRSGASIASSLDTRPGRGVITTMRVERKTDSNTEWVTNTTVMRKLAPQRDQIVVEPKARDLVERSERLVHQENARRGDQRARDRDPHPHAAGQFARIRLREIGEADALQRLHDRGAAAARSMPASLSGRKTLPNTVVHGISVGSWNTKPRPRRARAVLPVTVPRDGSLKPAMMRSAVDLPQPEGPEQRQEFARRAHRDRGRRAPACRCRTPCRHRAAKRWERTNRAFAIVAELAPRLNAAVVQPVRPSPALFP